MLKQLVIIFALVSFFGAFALAQDKTSTDKKNKKECSMGCCSGHESHGSMSMVHMESDSTKNMHHEMKSDDRMHGMHHEIKSDDKMHGMHHEMKTDSMSENSIVREGEINLGAIDENKDGKVFQDQMCWNVLSDEAGECPQCGMKLKEVSFEKAKENLLKHDYKVK
jgi:hypothetical protein